MKHQAGISAEKEEKILIRKSEKGRTAKHVNEMIGLRPGET